jgi:hypothetical protein
MIAEFANSVARGDRSWWPFIAVATAVTLAILVVVLTMR